jgi:Ca2+-binding RTX toxin-like protein
MNDFRQFRESSLEWSLAVPNPPTNGNDFIDLLQNGSQNDNMNGLDGNDTILGEASDDMLFGGSGNDTLLGGTGGDDLHGGLGVDQLYGDVGNSNLDIFFFDKTDSGDAYAGQADTIYDFGSEDAILLTGKYTLAEDTLAPPDGQYAVWQKDGHWMVTWNAFGDDGYHDVNVYGTDPHNHVHFYY